MTIKRCSKGSIPIVKQFSGKNVCPVKNGPQNGANSWKWGSRYEILCSRTRKGTSLRGTACFGVFCVKSRPGALAVASCKNPKNGKKISRVHTFGAQSHACAETKPLGGSWRTFVQVYGSTTQSPLPTFMTVAYGVWAWWGVKCWVSPLTCIVALTTLLHYCASVWLTSYVIYAVYFYRYNDIVYSSWWSDLEGGSSSLAIARSIGHIIMLHWA